MEKICLECNKKFETKYVFKKYCSKECAELVRKKYYYNNIKKLTQYRLEHKEYYKKWYEENKERLIEGKRKYYLEHREQHRKQQHKYYLENCEKIKKGSKEWRLKNLKAIRDKSRIKLKYKYYNNIEYKLLVNLRSRVKMALKKETKNGKTIELIGCTIHKLKEHLEQQFKPGMNWQNHGIYGWHIDHIIPCTEFDLSKEEEQKKCFHYTNLQPLWAHENLIKGYRPYNRILVEVQ